MRLAMISIVDSALKWVPTIAPTLFVDDLSAEVDGDEEAVVEQLGTFTRLVMLNIATDGMEVNKIKSLVSASSPALADKIIEKLGDDPIAKARRVRSLGVGLGAGVVRNTRVQNDRLKNEAAALQDPEGCRS